MKIQVKYPDGYKGARRLKEGVDYEVSPETAEMYRTKGILHDPKATQVKEEEKIIQQPVEAPEPDKKKSTKK